MTHPIGPARLLWFWIAAVLVLVLDLVTKSMILDAFAIGGPEKEVFGEFFRLRHIRNSGGLFGLLPGNAVYFAVVSAIAVGVILWVVHRSRDRDRLKLVALGLVLGGALGNLHDRIRFREVVDFLDVGVGAHRWPTFNVADSGVTVGVSILVLWLLLTERRRAPETLGTGEAGDRVRDADTSVEPSTADRSS